MALPATDAGTRVPSMATTLRIAITTNSRVMMMTVTHTDARFTETRAISTPLTKILSAVVSRKAPNVEVMPWRRAMYPSKASLRPAQMTSIVATPKR